jgi:hypothetical protein
VSRRPSYATVVSTIALFFALGGTAAGAKVWITGADVKDRSLTGADVADRSIAPKKLRLGSLTSALVRDGSLRSSDFDPAALAGLTGPAGPAGSAGPKGDQGAQGPKGDPGSSDIVRLSATAPDASHYVDDTVLLSQAVSADGGWLVWASLTVTNTSAVDDGLNCGLRSSGGGQFGGGGDWFPAGTTRQLNVVGFGPVGPSQPVELWCVSNGNGGTFDVTGIGAKLAKIM